MSVMGSDPTKFSSPLFKLVKASAELMLAARKAGTPGAVGQQLIKNLDDITQAILLDLPSDKPVRKAARAAVAYCLARQDGAMAVPGNSYLWADDYKGRPGYWVETWVFVPKEVIDEPKEMIDEIDNG